MNQTKAKSRGTWIRFGFAAMAIGSAASLLACAQGANTSLRGGYQNVEEEAPDAASTKTTKPQPPQAKPGKDAGTASGPKPPADTPPAPPKPPIPDAGPGTSAVAPTV